MIPKQFRSYAFVGALATSAHYALLTSLVELAGWRIVPAALCGYVLGGVVSYWLNRRHTFFSQRPHREAIWRFALIALFGFCCTYLLMTLFVERVGIPYLPAQIATTLIGMSLSFLGNRGWTFR